MTFPERYILKPVNPDSENPGRIATSLLVFVDPSSKIISELKQPANIPNNVITDRALSAIKQTNQLRANTIFPGLPRDNDQSPES